MFKRKSTKKLISYIVAVVFVLASTCLGTVPVYAADGTSTVNWNNVNQEIDGFGCSDAFHQAAQLQKCNTTVQNQVLDLLFSTTDGAGLSIVRNDIGDGATWVDDVSWAHSTIEPSQGTWNDSVLNDDQLWFMNQAKSYGVNKFFSTAWTPPGWMKTNGSPINGGNLRTDMYQAYADYLSRYVRDYSSLYGINIYAVSLANEPQNSMSYSSCLWDGTMFDNVIKNNIISTFAKDNVNTKVMIAEDGGWSESYALNTLNDSAAVDRLDIVGSHCYDSGTAPFTTSLSKNKTVWETEASNMGPNDNTINDQLFWAKLINDHMNSNASAWCYWWGVTPRNGGDALINNLNTTNNTYQICKRLYAVANYSRFIRPGYVRISNDSNPTSGVYVTSYKNNSDGKFVIVAINQNTSSKAINFNLNGFTASTVTPYRTSSTENLAQLSNINVTNGTTLSATLNAQSITTFVGTKVTGSGGQQSYYDDFESDTIGQNASGWTTDGGTWQVVQPAGNSKEYSKTSTGDNTALAGSSWTNYSVQGYLNLADDTNGGVCLLGRVQDDTHYYQVEFKKDGSGNKKWWIWKNNGGAWTQIATGYFPYAAGTYYLAKLDMNGSKLTASVSTDWGATFTTLGYGQDTSYSSGKIGVRSWGSGGTFDCIKVVSD